MTLRPYQQAAVDAAWDWMKTSVDPFLIDAATGAGKSHIIAAIAHKIHNQTGKRVLCLAPSAELVTQNRAKYLASGHKASMFSASAGAKELRHPVVFGSPLTVKNCISRFKDGYAMVVIDEAHGITPTVRAIIDTMRAGNPNIRVCGLTATPYRLGSGYIFRQWPDDKINHDDTTRDPYFVKCVSQITAPELIEQGFLTPPLVGTAGAVGYETAAMTANKLGKFDSADVDRAYHGHGRKTGAIVADVMAQSHNRRGVMFFAATVQHAMEVMASLPPSLSAIITAKTPAGERRAILGRFLAQELKYLVNVSVLTTGFDAPHVDCIAILRKTESIGLLQQIIGRGLRLHPNKADCLILDYTSNIEEHCPDGDLFAPEVRAGRGAGDGEGMTCVCPECSFQNKFTVNPDYFDHNKDEAGYCLDLDGQQIQSEFGPIAGHYGRRCMGLVQSGPQGKHDRCGYRWTSKPCLECDAPNDIAARYCTTCKAEIVNPNEKLRMEFARIKRTPTERQTDKIVSMDIREGVSQRGNVTIRADFVTPYRSFSVWFNPNSNYPRQQAEYDTFRNANANSTPATVTYQKDAATKFYRVFAFNRKEDTNDH